MPLTRAEFIAAVEHDRKNPRLCSCGCGKPLEPRFDGERHKIDSKEVNEDCYFESFGKELEDFPIGTLRISRGT